VNRFFRDRLTLILAIVTFASYFVHRDFFYGVLLFYLNFFSFKILVGRFFKNSGDDIGSVKKYIVFPAVFLKFSSLGGISYFVLVYLEGNPYIFIGGFGFGIAIFTLGLWISNGSGREVVPEEK
jgi:hypothetical protein